MKRIKTLFCTVLALSLFQASAFASEGIYGLFLVDQSEAMNQPVYAPRYYRALETTVKQLQTFVEEAQEQGKTPYFKIVTFNAAMGYGERTAWTFELDEAWDALALLYDEQGFAGSALDEALCAAGSDLQSQALDGGAARSYLFTNARSEVSFACGEVLPESALRAKQNADVAAMKTHLAETAQWRVFLYDGLPVEQQPAKALAAKSAGKDPVQLGSNAPIRKETALERLATASQGVTFHQTDSRDYAPAELPCVLSASGCEASKRNTYTFWQYFSIGKNSKNIKRLGSPSANYWYGGDLNIAAKSNYGVSAVRYQDRTYVFYRGESHENMHYAYSDDNGATWSGGGYVTTGGGSPVTITTPETPSAIVVNGKIRLFYHQSGYSYGPIRYIDSTYVHASGALNWSANSVYTGQDSTTPNTKFVALVDPTTNEELLIFGSRATGKLEMYGRSLSMPGQWQAKKTFATGISTDLEAVHTGSDLFIAYRGTNNSLYFMKKSNNYTPHHVQNRATFHKPGLAYLNGKTVIVFQTTGGRIDFTSSFDNGVTWAAVQTGPEITHRALDLVAYTYTQPLAVSINGPFYGDVGETQTWTASASGGTQPYSYQWNVDGFPAGNGTQMSYTFFRADSYLISLTVTDANGNSKTTSRIFTILDDDLSCGRFVICP